MKYQAYEEYKESGVEWLGKVPNNWIVSKLGYLINTIVPMRDKPTHLKGNIPWIRIEDFDGKYISDSKSGQGVSDALIKDMHLKVFPVGTVLCTCSCSMGTTAIVKKPLISNQTFIGLVPGHSLCSEYLYYLMQASEAELTSKSAGAIQQYLSQDEFKSLRFGFPALHEQEQIANFLNYETAKIDTLIEKQQQLIKLLKEKRQAVISHAVTKGLNPNAPMRDSGVEWLGEVPEHWVVKRLKHISPKIGVGLVINPSTYTRDEGIYFIFGGDVKEYKFDLSKTRRISPEDSDNLLPSRLNYRDLVSIRVGYPGITAVVTEELEGSNCASVIVIRRGKYNSDWLCAAMNVWVGRQQVDLVSYGAAQKQFNVADAIDFIFPVPPEEEQNGIAEFVDKSLSRFNTLSEKAEKQIELLNERRTALISAAVTGKIDVRHHASHPTGSANTAMSENND